MWLPNFFLRLKVLELRTAPHHNLIGQLGQLELHPPDPTYWQAIRYVKGVKKIFDVNCRLLSTVQKLFVRKKLNL